jgi:hypothetical protein
MWSKPNHIAAIALDLKSAYEEKHTIFGLLNLANLAQNDKNLIFWNDLGSTHNRKVFEGDGTSLQDLRQIDVMLFQSTVRNNKWLGKLRYWWCTF